MRSFCLLVVLAVFQVISGCPPEYSKCKGEPWCFRNEYTCDGDPDCWFHGSDEENCDSCVGNHTFLCANEQRCITDLDLCDGHRDCSCGDGISTDEENCDECNGPFTYHCAAEKRCILDWPGADSHRCDGHFDCASNETASDEQGCEQWCADNDMIRCNDQSTRCIPKNYWCDKHIHDDCPGGEDESNCTAAVCGSLGKYYCAADDKCIEKNWECDAYQDCSDNADEIGCTKCNGKGRFLCTADQKCIPGYYRCDGHDDCSDGDDEDRTKCETWCDEKDRWMCNDQDGECIPEDWRCDGMYDDCISGEDEDNCGGGKGHDSRELEQEYKRKETGSLVRHNADRRPNSQRINDYKRVMSQKDKKARRNLKADRNVLTARRNQHKQNSRSFKRTEDRRHIEGIQDDERILQHKTRKLEKLHEMKLRRERNEKRSHVESKTRGNQEESLERRLESLEARLTQKLLRRNPK